jgi:hypothetical protein
MPSDVFFPYRWKDMPDPRSNRGQAHSTTVIEIHERDWRKVIGKHFSNSKEPWIEILPVKELQSLVSDGGVLGLQGESSSLALDVIGKQLRASLARPLVIFYTCIGKQVQGQGHRWVLVLPSGAIAIAWVEKPMVRLKTCYFSGSVAVKPKDTRWKHALRQHVQEYATYDESKKVYVYPDRSKRSEVSDSGSVSEVRYFISFVNAGWWGFASSNPGAIWKYPTWHWSI